MDDLALSPEFDAPYDTSSDAFYEDIEAPKFVDLTDKDPVRVDDRYWFCLRVGCDQKHEEELDSEEVYKKFILRVMAARSPNVRLRKALSGRCGPMGKAKCPQSAPPKSTRPQVSRLAIVSSSMATRLEGLKSKCVEYGTKDNATPNTKVKVVSAKYMTTPRNKNNEPRLEAFRSVQNTKKVGSVGEVKSRVAKALVFHSPKKTVKLKASLELKTPVRKMCEKLKKLELDEEGSKKRVLGNSTMKTAASDLKPKAIDRPWRVDGSSKAKNIAVAENKKDMSQTCAKPIKGSDENKVHEKLGNVGKQEVLENVKVAEEQHCAPELPELLLDVKAMEEHQYAPMLPKDVKVIEEHQCALVLPGELQEAKATDKQEPALELHDKVKEEGEDDKENKSGTDQNQCKSGAGRKVPSSGKTCIKFVKVAKPMGNPKSGTAADAEGLKYRKPKPTTPKPFRLRTDERGILKESHSVRKVLPVGKCEGENTMENKSICKKMVKPNSNVTKEVQEKPRMSKPNKASTPLECGKAISLSKTTKTPEKPKSILISSSMRKAVTPNRENIARKPTVTFLIPGEKTPEIPNVKESERLRKVSNMKSPTRERSQTPKKSPSAWRLP